MSSPVNYCSRRDHNAIYTILTQGKIYFEGDTFSATHLAPCCPYSVGQTFTLDTPSLSNHLMQRALFLCQD